MRVFFTVIALLLLTGCSQCWTETELLVQGSSMEPVLHNQETYRLLKNYYACNPVQRGDIVIHRYAWDRTPYVKGVHGIPGDSFWLEGEERGHRIIINGEAIKTFGGKEYVIGPTGAKRLQLYVDEYNKTIPPETVLILAELESGSYDATRFGLVAKEDILGKVLLKEN